jgi:glycosyltransferase involved in cell wall biosynthesis
MVSIAIIGAAPTELLNFRGDLIRTLSDEGHKVIAMTNNASPSQLAAIQDLGAEFVPYRIRQRSQNPLNDLWTLLQLRKTLLQLKPDIVLSYTVKPIIWSGLVLRSLPKTEFYGLVEGAGYAFQGTGLRRKLLTKLVTRLYRVGLKRSKTVFFLNRDDPVQFTQLGIVGEEKVHILDGIGVDLEHYQKQDLAKGDAPAFLLVSRLLGEKGIREYAKAASIVRKQYPDAEFRLLGGTDASSDGVPLAEIQSWHDAGDIAYLGSASDVRPHLKDCHVFVLPSYYGEGLPRTIMEAMSTGRPILTTDNVGCRETVEPGKNGFLVEKENADDLAQRMIWFIENRHEWQCMGDASRAMAEEKFNVHEVNKVILQKMGIA